MTQPIYRPATHEDVPALAQLGIESFVAKFGDMYSEKDLNTFLNQAFSRDAVAGDVADPQRVYRLAEDGSGLVGYCKMALKCGWPEFARGTNAVELKQLYTAPDATGRGIGGALMDWALELAAEHGADEVQLSVWSGNEGAQRFYARYGFEKVADITFPVGEQIDEEFLFAKML